MSWLTEIWWQPYEPGCVKHGERVFVVKQGRIEIGRYEADGRDAPVFWNAPIQPTFGWPAFSIGGGYYQPGEDIKFWSPMKDPPDCKWEPL